MKNKIIEKSGEMFRQFGYSKVTLSEIATEMGISKKTIYNYFDGKEQLLYAVIDSSRQKFEENIRLIESKTDDFREMVREILSLTGMRVTELQVFQKDLKKNHPEAFTHFANIRKDVIIKNAMDIMHKGRKLNMLNDDAKTETALFIFLATAEKVADQDYLNHLPTALTEKLPAHPVEIFRSIIEIIYQGIKK